MDEGWTDHGMVRDMYKRFGILAEPDGPPVMISQEQVDFRLKALHEELSELEQAYASGDLVAVADALVDLVVFAHGTAALHRLPWGELFGEVQRSNNDKVVGPSRKDRGPGKVDLLKPDGWRPPDLHRVLARAGFSSAETHSKP